MEGNLAFPPEIGLSLSIHGAGCVGIGLRAIVYVMLKHSIRRLSPFIVFSLVVGVHAQSPEQSNPEVITLDGSLEEWPDGAAAVAGDRWMYFRHDVDEPLSLQSGPVMTVLQIDLDSDGSTGHKSAGSDLGVDLEISMTTLDPRDPSILGGGIEISAFGANDSHEALTHMNIGFSSLPTHASVSFEIRLARELVGPNWFEQMAATTKEIRFRFVHRDELFTTTWAGEVKSLAMPPLVSGPEQFDIKIPGKSADSVRIVSWNVLWGTPSKKPDGFARALRTLNPDVIMFQEWDKGYWTKEPRITVREYVTWLNTNLGDGPWSVTVGDERGVLIASRSQLAPFLPVKFSVKADRNAGIRSDREVRCASALVETPLGSVGAVSIHLKSRGGLDSREDRIRFAEAGVVHDALKSVLATKRPDFLVIAGDWNLVGGRAPLEHAIDGIDFDGSDLKVVEPRRLGSGDAITWREQRSPFAPGRLDYALVADAGVEIVQSFVLDTSLFTDASLRRAGLKRTDTDDSDHLPLVMDLRRGDMH